MEKGGWEGSPNLHTVPLAPSSACTSDLSCPAVAESLILTPFLTLSLGMPYSVPPQAPLHPQSFVECLDPSEYLVNVILATPGHEMALSPLWEDEEPEGQRCWDIYNDHTASVRELEFETRFNDKEDVPSLYHESHFKV